MGTTTQLLVGMVILLSAVGINYYIAEGDTAYSCKEEKVTLCWKLSKLNDNDISTRCYYNISAVRTYKICRTGWNLFDSPNLTGDLTEIKPKIDLEEDLRVKSLEFKDFPEIISEAKITRIWKRLDDDFIRVEWEIEVLNKQVDRTETLTGRFRIPEEKKNNNSFIQDKLEKEIRREFVDYNQSFIPNPIIEYKDHPLWR